VKGQLVVSKVGKMNKYYP